MRINGFAVRILVTSCENQKYAVPRQIKPGILKFTTSGGHRNLHTVFSFVSCEEKGCYRIVSFSLRIQPPLIRSRYSLGHQNFDCRPHYALSRRMQVWSSTRVPSARWSSDIIFSKEGKIIHLLQKKSNF